MRDALEELQALPDEAEERTIALPVLAEVRLTMMARIGLRSPREEEELLMKMSPIYEAWKERVEREGMERGLEQGREQGVRGLRAAIVAFFEGRFGPMPDDVRATVEGMRDLATLTAWSTRLATADRDAVLQMMRASRA